MGLLNKFVSFFKKLKHEHDYDLMEITCSKNNQMENWIFKCIKCGKIKIS